MCDSWTATSEGVGGWGVGGRSRGGGKTSASTTKCFKDQAGWVEARGSAGNSNKGGSVLEELLYLFNGLRRVWNGRKEN